MNDSVAYLRSRWTPELTAAAVNFLRTGREDSALPMLEHEGKHYYDLRGIRVEQTQLDEAMIRNVNLRWSTFRDVGFKDAHLTQCDLSQTLFVQCYFRRTVFEHCNIINSKFQTSDFSDARIKACSIDFAAFKECEISLQTIRFEDNTHPHVLARICRNLKMNAVSMGYMADSAQLTYMEKTYERRALYQSAFARKQGSLNERFRAFVSWVISLFFNCLWGYGERPLRLMLGMSAGILLFGILQYWVDALPGHALWEHIYFSGITFLTIGYGDLAPISPISRALAVIEGAVGIMLLGMLIASWTKKIMFR